MTKTPKRPRDPNELAKMIAGIATGEVENTPTAPDSQRTEIARAGGLRGGKARAESLTPEQRSEIARKAAAKRWAKD
ncbi:MAG: histone H1 [Caulobacter sp.]|nr:histone H1 [Caulobacter sp.]